MLRTKLSGKPPGKDVLRKRHPKLVAVGQEWTVDDVSFSTRLIFYVNVEKYVTNTKEFTGPQDGRGQGSN